MKAGNYDGGNRGGEQVRRRRAAAALALAMQPQSRVRYLLAWELQQLLWSLGFTDKLADEHAIEAARVVALHGPGQGAWREPGEARDGT